MSDTVSVHRDAERASEREIERATPSRSLAPVVVSVSADSPAAAVGVRAGDEIVQINGDVPRDIIEWQMAADEADVELDVRRGGLDLAFSIEKRAGEPLGVDVSSAVFDRVRTCDNHCEFCFIYQLPKGCLLYTSDAADDLLQV